MWRVSVLIAVLFIAACERDEPALSDREVKPPKGYTEMCEREPGHALCP